MGSTRDGGRTGSKGCIRYIDAEQSIRRGDGSEFTEVKGIPAFSLPGFLESVIMWVNKDYHCRGTILSNKWREGSRRR